MRPRDVRPSSPPPPPGEGGRATPGALGDAARDPLAHLILLAAIIAYLARR